MVQKFHFSTPSTMDKWRKKECYMSQHFILRVRQAIKSKAKSCSESVNEQFEIMMKFLFMLKVIYLNKSVEQNSIIS